MPPLKIPKSRDEFDNNKAVELYQKTYQEFHRKYGKPDNSALHIINDIAMLEQLKQKCWDDVNDEGVMVEWQNGVNQGGKREHPLISKINQTTEQQRKLLGEIKLTPSSQKLIASSGKTGGDEFEAF